MWQQTKTSRLHDGHVAAVLEFNRLQQILPLTQYLSSYEETTRLQNSFQSLYSIRTKKKMHSVREKVSNAAAAGKEHVDILKAKAEEKAEKAAARTKEEKTIAEEVRKAKEAEAKMELHQAKARHAAEKLQSKQAHLGGILGPRHHHGPAVGGQAHQTPAAVGTTVPTTGSVAPTYPLGGYPPSHGHI
ncbi:hypothetical protein HAX54_006034 [Datura stramonium]|uniref:Uncharacterized protein n=1 Tax=Datura stramonium TaxID=4076 RepID=A0ABS8RVY2_DATST|nr:hypothetical protein [Datura stramonium]